MNPADICAALEAAGARIEFADGKPRLRGSPPPPEVAAALKEHRAAVIEEWVRRAQAARDRYGKVPAEPLPLRATLLGQAEGMSAAGMLKKRLVLNHVVRQSQPVCDWIITRSNDYYERVLATQQPARTEECDFTACVDLLCWQTRRQWGSELIGRLQAFADVAALKTARLGEGETRSDT